MGAIGFARARVPSRHGPVAVADLLVERRCGDCEVDVEGALWMDWTVAEEFSALAAEPVVVHPGLLLGRQRGYAIRAVVEQLRGLRERVDPKGRTGPVRAGGHGPRGC
jgi:hypothetical protein